MARSPGRHRPGGGDRNQLLIDWNAKGPANQSVADTPALFGPAKTERPTLPQPEPLVQWLKWDFKTTFPQPTEAAVDEGVIDAADLKPDAIRFIHEEHARQALAALCGLDAVMDAKRRGVDPRNNKKPMLAEAKLRLQKCFETESARLEHWFQTLLDTYVETFGTEAADQFNKAIRAWHAGIEVRAEVQRGRDAENEVPQKQRVRRRPAEQLRVVAVLPVPRPLPAAIAAGRFGYEDDGRPVPPSPDEVRAITIQQAENLVGLLDAMEQASGSCVATERARLSESFASAIAAYTQDFGERAARQLEAYARRQASLDDREVGSFSRHR